MKVPGSAGWKGSERGKSPTGEGTHAARRPLVPSVWSHVEEVIARRIEARTGIANGIDFVVSALENRPNPRFLSLGAGSCSLETQWILPRLRSPETCLLECIDRDSELIQQGAASARASGFRFVGGVLDINELELEPERYDVILCWASLHRFVELDHIAAQIQSALKPQGILVATDICTRNGFLLWPETRRIVNEFWELLPAPYRIAHSIGQEPIACVAYPEIDFSNGSPERMQSEAILPALERHLERRHLILAHSLLRRFFDNIFGPNFDMRRGFDRSFFAIIRDYDEMALETGRLRPETFFGVYQKRQAPLRSPVTLGELLRLNPAANASS